MIIEEIKKQILTRLQEKNLNISSLERKAGLPRSSIRNFFHGASNNPGIASLEAIAKVLECSVDELIGKVYKTESKAKPKQDVNREWIEELFYNILNYIAAYTKKMGYKVTLEKMFFYLKESYIYSLEKNNNKMDKKFIEWIIEKNTD